MTSIPQNYDPAAAETRWRKRWEDQGLYRWDPAAPRSRSFVVDTPPPTVSGVLHIGHVFSYTHQDLVVRYRRMRGEAIHYGMGWDDNGLPTERRVQNYFGIRCNPRLPYDPGWTPQPHEEGRPIVEVSRPNFIEACERVTEQDEAAFEELWRRLGLSIDWSQTYRTIDARSRRISQLSFLELVERGQVFQTVTPTMWDVDFKSAVAQAEVEDRMVRGLMSTLRFGVEGGGELRIATTRPELLGACIAVAAHPEDARYRDHFGKHAVTPLYRARVPIVAARHADPQKGTGLLMICTFGDGADVEWWKTSGLAVKPVIGLDGRIQSVRLGEPPFQSLDAKAAQRAHEALAGLTAQQAKKRILELLAEPGSVPDGSGAALAGEPQPLEHLVRFYEKGDRPLEYISTRQWYVHLLEHKQAFLEQGRKIEWHPEFMRARYEHWVEGLNQDWCVSRQRYFGVPFPVWYPVGADGTTDYARPIYAPRDRLPVDPLADTPPGFTAEQRDLPGGFTGDPDVMDTWATSSLSPQIQSHWDTDPERHGKLFPMDLRPQAHEIIRTWAFYTIVKAWMHEEQIPWRHVLIAGWILDPERKKMSKSRGNVVTPAAILDQYSVDAVRYWAGRARPGTDTTYDPKVLEIGRRLTTKIFNASRFVKLQQERVGATPADLRVERISHPADLALVAHLEPVVARATQAFEGFDFSVALREAEQVFWDYCDHYLELVKRRAQAEQPGAERDSATAAAHWGLQTLLRLLAPFVPYVTEECWSWWPRDNRRERSIHTAPWPSSEEVAALPSRDRYAGSLAAAVEVLTAVRGAKSRAQKSLKWPVAALEAAGSAEGLEALRPVLDDVLKAGWVEPDAVTLKEAPVPERGLFEVKVSLAQERGQAE
jgi:valyl-tRNA synthetase